MDAYKSDFHTGTFTETESAYIDKLQSEDDKKLFRNAIVAAYDSNGRESAETSGAAISYIKRTEFYQNVIVEGLPEEITKPLELALNWSACGKGKGGLAGAAVRWKLRDLMDLKRETVRIDEITDGHKVLLKEYLDFYAANPTLHSVWSANAWNVFGIATSCFIREQHHWDAQNTRPQKALIGALNQDNEITDAEIRKLFYIAIHPIPLRCMAMVTKKAHDSEDTDISEVVKMRLEVAPAGLAVVAICASVVTTMTNEFSLGQMKKEHVDSVNALTKAGAQIKSAPLNYHPFAAHFGVERETVNLVPLKLAMCMTAGFIKSQVRGTLAQSPALNKWIGTEQRLVTRFSDAFTKYYEDHAEDLIQLITGSPSEERKTENVNSSLKTLTKIAQIQKDQDVNLEAVQQQVLAKLKANLT